MNLTFLLMFFWGAAALSYLAVYRRRLPALSGTLSATLWSVTSVGALGYEIGARQVVFESRAVGFLAAGMAFLMLIIAVLDILGRLPEMDEIGGATP